jgi:hypothetical protein
MGDGFDLATQLLSNLTAATDSNDGAANDESFFNVGSVRESDATPPCDPTSKLISDRFDLASQPLLSNYTNSVANSSYANVNNSNYGVISNKYPLLTKQQRSSLSYSNPTLNCDGLNKLDNCDFDVIVINNDKGA